jgi:anti-sigma regulatory factor (Ser/Thr protein kinase)
MSEQPHVHLRMVSSPVYLGGARELITGIARSMGFGAVGSSQIALAVDEALCNVIRHGYDRQADRPIWIDIWPTRQGGLKIVIEDEAKQVDPEQIKGRALEDIRPGGLGVHIIKEVMNEVRFEKRDGRGMRLTMVKNPEPKPGSAGASESTESGPAGA